MPLNQTKPNQTKLLLYNQTFTSESISVWNNPLGIDMPLNK